jgi:hypothetical protein
MKKITVEYANDLEKKLFEMGHKFGNAEYRPAAKQISVRIIKNFKSLEDCKTNDEVSELWTGLSASAYQNRYGIAFNE